ncbi:MAG: indole-3-glycerol phosphate synthase TrpC, partial [Bacteroidota bacterium]
AQRKLQMPVQLLEQKPLFKKATTSLKKALLGKTNTGIVAEYKRRSPSKGIINGHSTVTEVTAAYEMSGASAISILTDEIFFGGSLIDLEAAQARTIPLLRKDFMIDEYQLIEAKAFGADVILLIAACLTPPEVKSMSATAQRLGLEVLLELHDETELSHLCDDVSVVGINNRSLRTFEVSLEHSVNLSAQIGEGFVKIAESGINSINDINYLKQHGFNGFLIGEYFMKHQNPGEAFKNFATAL